MPIEVDDPVLKDKSVRTNLAQLADNYYTACTPIGFFKYLFGNQKESGCRKQFLQGIEKVSRRLTVDKICTEKNEITKQKLQELNRAMIKEEEASRKSFYHKRNV